MKTLPCSYLNNIVEGLVHIPFLHSFRFIHKQMVEIMTNSVFQILLLLVSLTIQASGAAPRLALPKCDEKCGNVAIPFPFGIGTGCFLDDWYEIVCQQNNTVPILNKIGAGVLNISLPDFRNYRGGEIKVSLQLIHYAHCKRSGISKPVSLEGSKLVFSQRWNIFTLVGCNTKATVISTESNGIVFTSTGCRTKCAGTNTNISWYGSCSKGDGCCQATVPSDLQTFKVDTKKEGGQQGCHYAFLAERSWFWTLNVSNLHELVMNNMFPVVLEWGIANNTRYSHELRRQNNDEIYGSSYYSPVNCGGSLFSTEMPFMQCYCGVGYHGNPYLIKGCKGKLLHGIRFCTKAPYSEVVCSFPGFFSEKK